MPATSKDVRRAAKVMVIRHGEKPPDKGKPLGIDDQGKADEESLTVRGWQRAGALVALFAPSDGLFPSPHLATPNHLYAAKVGPQGDSQRLRQTIEPLGEKLGLPINLDHQKHETDALVADALAAEGVVLISWSHEDIVAIAEAILGGPLTPPRLWPEERYDLVWVFDREASGAYAFSQVPQLLLAGDSPTLL